VSKLTADQYIKKRPTSSEGAEDREVEVILEKDYNS